MKIAVEGCAHGELDTIYDTIKYVEEQEDIKIDLLICCGDFQSTRNEADLKCMAVPPKHSKMCSFYKYYNGEKEAPILTIFIGGNHEASNYLQELPYGGWVAPNIYYLGYAGVINVAGIRIGGLSGIYKGRDYMKGHFEKPPYDDNTKRSVYHIRNLEVFRLKQISDKLDIFLSHDWPTGICDFGNKEQLIKFKPFFKEDIESGKLGSKPCEELLHTLKPSYWFAAHLHCKFAALVQHEDDKKTKFLALDKCLPKRRFLQIIDLPTDPSEEVAISYDVEWLTVLFMTNHLINVKNVTNYMPGPAGNERWNFTPTEEEKLTTMKQFNNDLKVPLNFQKTVLGFVPDSLKKTHISQPSPKANPQTVSFCKKLGIDDPIALLTDLNDSIISIDDTINSSLDDSVIFVPDTPMRKLNLPQPKMDSSSDLIEVSNLSILSRGSSDEPKTDLSQEFNEYEKSEQSPNEEEKNEFQTEISDTPLRKKFKRRNATMYDTEAV